jgi:hypothetical protein
MFKTSIFVRLKAKARRLKKKGIKKAIIKMYPRG